MSFKYKYKDHDLLPISREPEFPHFLEGYHPTDKTAIAKPPEGPPAFCDYIVTTLANLIQYPNALKDFLDLSIKSVKFTSSPTIDDGGPAVTMMIWRTGNTVICGSYAIREENHQAHWELASKSKISEVGVWTCIWAAEKAISQGPIETLKPSSLLPLMKTNDNVVASTVDPDSVEAVTVLHVFANTLVHFKVWDDTNNYKCHVEVSKD